VEFLLQKAEKKKEGSEFPPLGHREIALTILFSRRNYFPLSQRIQRLFSGILIAMGGILLALLRPGRFPPKRTASSHPGRAAPAGGWALVSQRRLKSLQKLIFSPRGGPP